MADLGERSPEEARQLRKLRVKFIKRCGLSDSNAVDRRIDHHLKVAAQLRPRVEHSPKNLPLLYTQLAHFSAAALLGFDGQGPHSKRLRDLCARKGIRTTPTTPLLSQILKAFGVYDESTAAKRRAADKRISRDYIALSFVLSQGKLPGKELVGFLKEHGLNACSRRLRPQTSKRLSQNWREIIRMKNELCVPLGSRASVRMASLLDGSPFVIFGRAGETDVHTELVGTSPATVKTLRAHAKQLLDSALHANGTDVIKQT